MDITFVTGIGNRFSAASWALSLPGHSCPAGNQSTDWLPTEHMSDQSALMPIKALEGIHGVQLVPNSPFTCEVIKHEDLQQSTCESLTGGTSQQLILQ